MWDVDLFPELDLAFNSLSCSLTLEKSFFFFLVEMTFVVVPSRTIEVFLRDGKSQYDHVANVAVETDA